MSAPVRPIVLPGAHALAHLEGRLGEALEGWCAEWSALAPPPVRVAAGVGVDTAVSEWTEWTGSFGRVWIAGPAASNAGALHLVFGDATEGDADTWSLAAAAEAAGARDRCVAEALVGEVSATTRRAPDPLLRAFGSGAVTVRADAVGLLAVADAGALRHVAPRSGTPTGRAPLVPLLEAACGATVRLTVDAGGVELELSRLLELQPGDVIRLPTALTDPLPVLADGRTVATGALCRAGGHKALQLLTSRSTT